jgi:hypothetical protein
LDREAESSFHYLRESNDVIQTDVVRTLEILVEEISGGFNGDHWSAEFCTSPQMKPDRGE